MGGSNRNSDIEQVTCHETEGGRKGGREGRGGSRGQEFVINEHDTSMTWTEPREKDTHIMNAVQ